MKYFSMFSGIGGNEAGEEVKISDTQRYKCLGNAVTVNVVAAIVKELMVDFKK